jgi:putative oxidoreductase
MDLALLVVRLVVGALMVGHGMQKLQGWFGGHGLEGTGAFFESLGLRPGRRNALAAGATEVAGGVLIAAGLLTPLGAAMLSAVMLAAIWTVHRPNGIWAGDGGMEYNVVLLAVLFVVAGAGPGAWSLDHAFGIEAAGAGWALAQLAVGALGAAAIVAAGRAPAVRRHGAGRAHPTPS